MTTAALGLIVSDIVRNSDGRPVYMTEETRKRFLRAVDVPDHGGEVYFRGVQICILGDDECLIAGNQTRVALIHE